MFKIPLKGRTYGALKAESAPSLPGQPEEIPAVFYDTQLYTSGTTTRMRFFAQTSTDRTITNMVNAGQFPDPDYFIWHGWGCDILIDASTSADQTGAADDVAKLVLISRAIATFNLFNKDYGPVPLSFLHASGGPTGIMSHDGAAAAVQVGFANNGVFDGGWPWNGAIYIPPKAGFRMEVEFSAAQTLNAGNTYLRMWMYGALSRKVQ